MLPTLLDNYQLTIFEKSPKIGFGLFFILFCLSIYVIFYHMETIKCFGPIFDSDSKILILGSMPSIASLEQNFYYMHPTNRFWSVIAEITQSPFPKTIEERRNLVLDNKIALWDVIYECRRKGSLDSAIRDAHPNDLYKIPNIEKLKIFTNGRLAHSLLKKFFPRLKSQYLPSTSAANVRFDKQKWLDIKKHL